MESGVSPSLLNGDEGSNDKILHAVIAIIVRNVSRIFFMVAGFARLRYKNSATIMVDFVQ
jgi:hypothetical protein